MHRIFSTTPESHYTHKKNKMEFNGKSRKTGQEQKDSGSNANFFRYENHDMTIISIIIASGLLKHVDMEKIYIILPKVKNEILIKFESR